MEHVLNCIFALAALLAILDYFGVAMGDSHAPN
jgi:hypothetical protein